MLRFPHLSIGVILPAILVSMTVLLVGAGAATVFRADAQARRSERAVVLTEASRSLLGALLATRRERSTFLTEFASGEHRSEADAASLVTLGQRVTDGTERVLTWIRAAEADVTATAEPLQRAHEALVALRQEAAAALALPKAQRRSATRDAAEARYQALLAALAAANEAVDGAIPREDTTLAGTLAVKRSTWKARTAIGTVATRIQTSLAAGTGWTQAEAVAAAEERGRLAATWAEVAEAAAGAVPDLVRNAFRKADVANFEGEAAARRKYLTEALSQGQRPELTFQVVRARDIEEQNTIVDLANAALDALVARARMLADEAQATRRNAALFLGALLLLAGTGLLVTARRILRPIRGMTQAMRALAAGDAAVVIPTQRYQDEIGAMAGAVQVFKDNLIRSRVLEDEAAEARRSAEVQRRAATHEMAERFERAVAGIIAQVATAAAALQATAQQMADTAQGTARDSKLVAAAAGQAEANVTTVAAAAEELGGSIQEIRRQVSDSSDIARRAVDEADQTAALVTELHEAAEAIGNVVRLIAALAEQTNLLALNAAIEAARAGAAGRGFAVVAAEVKALAGQTAAATDDIAGQIGRIQRVTGDAVSAIGAILSRIREIAGLAGSVAASVEGQGTATRDIICHVADATAGTRAVTVTITTVAQAAAQTGAAAAHVLAAASDVSHHADALKTETDGFLITVRAA